MSTLEPKNVISITRNYNFFIEQRSILRPASKSIPKWYKESPHTTDPNEVHLDYDGTPLSFHCPLDPKRMLGATYKRCVPTFDAMTLGYIYELPMDIVFHEQTQSFEDTPMVQQTTHLPYESEGYVFPQDAYQRLFKWNSNNLIKLPPGYSGLLVTPFHRHDLPFYTLPGVVDMDNHPLPVNPPFVMKKNFSGKITKGTPLWQFIPIKREGWALKHEPDSPISDDVLYGFFEPNELGNPLTGVYKRKVREKKEYT